MSELWKRITAVRNSRRQRQRLRQQRHYNSSFQFDQLRLVTSSSSSIELTDTAQPLLQRFLSQHDHLCSELDEYQQKKANQFKSNNASSSTSLVIMSSTVQQQTTIVFGYMCGVSNKTATALSPAAHLDDSGNLDAALGICQLIKMQSTFSEGILLKCIDNQPLYPYLHCTMLKDVDKDKRLLTARRLQQQYYDDKSKKKRTTNDARVHFGAYEELYSIQKTSINVDSLLPIQRHTGYITISFKLLEAEQNLEKLEKSWLTWSGAREIYKYAPRSWNMRRITLYRRTICGINIDDEPPFVYVLVCEFGNILHPSNRLQALDMCERLRVRNCGHIALYQVQCTYGGTEAVAPTSASTTDRSRLAIERATQWKQQRGLSQDMAVRSRDRSLGYGMIDESVRYHSYHHFAAGD